MKKAAIGLVIALLAVFLASSCWYTIQEEEQAVVCTFGTPKAVTEPGLHFKIPLIQTVTKVNTTIQGISVGYDDDLQLELTSGSGNAIYYTLDGTDPVRRGQLYRDPILLTDGETTVKAAARNSDGIYSRVVEKTYRISYKKPDYPAVSPMQGEFHEPTYVTITAEEGSSVYYTWDGSVPTASSARYTEPLLISEA